MEIKVTIPDEKRNDIALKRMDLLERKIDQQYKSFVDNKNDSMQVIERLQSSFMNNFNKMMAMNKSMMMQGHNHRMDALRIGLEKKIKNLEEDKSDEEALKLFTDKFSALENAIKNITMKPQIVRVANDNNKNLFNSFNGILKKMETLIKDSRPRIYPSPS